jgi:hypothetical protein
MSFALVRSSVYDYLTTPKIVGVDYVFPGIPFDQAGVPWDTVITYGQTTRCFLVIVIRDPDDYGDKIFVLDGRGGRRVVPYPVTVEAYFEDISGKPAAALVAQDAMLDAIHARLQSDPSLGTQASSGVLVAAAPNLRIRRGELERQGEGDTFAAWSVFQFDVSVYEYQT